MSFKIPLEIELLFKPSRLIQVLLETQLESHIRCSGISVGFIGIGIISFLVYYFPFTSGLTHLYVYVYVSEAHPNV